MTRSITINVDAAAKYFASQGDELIRIETFNDGGWVTEYIYDSPDEGYECRIEASELAKRMNFNQDSWNK